MKNIASGWWGIFAVFKQLSKEEKKCIPYRMCCTLPLPDSFVAYDQFVVRHLNSNESGRLEILVVHDIPLGFDLLARIDAITTLVGIHVTQTGAVWLCSKKTCVAIHIDQTNFFVKFNHQQRIWTVKWK